MIKSSTLKELMSVCGKEHTLINGDKLKEYSSDASRISFYPDIVIFPESAEEISRILTIANRERISVVPRGAGTGTTGGALPVSGGIVISMDRLNRILRIDPDNMIAVVEPSVITSELQRRLEHYGLFYPPDPASADKCTIGGNVAECAGGLRAVKYGVTRDYVLGLEAVLPTGEIINTGAETVKGVVGYDLTRLLVGSEGTLAIITAIILRAIPKPETSKTIVAMFEDNETASRSVSEMMLSGIVPAGIEFMDHLCIKAIKDKMGIPVSERTSSILLIIVDGKMDEVKRDTEDLKKLLLNQKALSVHLPSTDEEERIWDARRELSPTISNLKPHKVAHDVVVPRSRIPELLSFIESLSNKYQLPIPCFGHAGDGNIHVNILFDASDPVEKSKSREIVDQLIEKVLELKGTISGEHGIGITKAGYIDREISQSVLELMRRIKMVFDPNNILNPGKIFPEYSYNILSRDL